MEDLIKKYKVKARCEKYKAYSRRLEPGGPIHEARHAAYLEIIEDLKMIKL